LSGRTYVVIDIGKTLSKLTLWSRDGVLLEKRMRPNPAALDGALDAAGIELWLTEVLSEFARLADVAAIIPVAHGAAAAIVRDGALAQTPRDYEAPIPESVRLAYQRQRDPFVQIGSPALPDGLNLGAQLFALEVERPDLFEGDAWILLWPQYWAWLLSGVAACELTSLGCHTDLWRPFSGAPSNLAGARGWDKRLPPLRRAGEVLGPILPAWAERTGLPADTNIHCGLHDSNAALVAARGFPDLAGSGVTVLSTGTWFVAMRVPSESERGAMVALPEQRDCLINIDAYGVPTPSARFMGGREIEILLDGQGRLDLPADQPALLAAAQGVVAAGAMVLPTFASGVGPFPRGGGAWVKEPRDREGRISAIGLYAALVADVSLDLVGARGPVLIEGRFAEAEVFTRALAALRPADSIHVSDAPSDVSFGALRMIDPNLRPAGSLARVWPLDVPLAGYKRDWRARAEVST